MNEQGEGKANSLRNSKLNGSGNWKKMGGLEEKGRDELEEVQLKGGERCK